MNSINTQFHFTAEKPAIDKDMAHIKSTKFLGGEKTVVDQLKEAQKSGKSTIVIDALARSDKAYETAFKGEFKGVFKKVIFYSESAALNTLRNRLAPPPKESSGYGKIALLALAAVAIGAAGYCFNNLPMEETLKSFFPTNGQPTSIPETSTGGTDSQGPGLVTTQNDGTNANTTEHAPNTMPADNATNSSG